VVFAEENCTFLSTVKVIQLIAVTNAQRTILESKFLDTVLTTQSNDVV